MWLSLRKLLDPVTPKFSPILHDYSWTIIKSYIHSTYCYDHKACINILAGLMLANFFDKW